MAAPHDLWNFYQSPHFCRPMPGDIVRSNQVIISEDSPGGPEYYWPDALFHVDEIRQTINEETKQPETYIRINDNQNGRGKTSECWIIPQCFNLVRRRS